MKRLVDLFVSFFGLFIFSPILLFVILLVWLEDKHFPFYIAPRVGYRGMSFSMVKLRSMTINADKSGVDSTATSDTRITRVGHFIRRYKLDELTQLWNVFIGDMSLVGPRPNVQRETDLYTREERRLLEVKPGITDISSIVFADEGDILKDQIDPDIAYNQLIRPGKSMLGLFYIEHRSLLLDIQICFLTVLAFFSREKALSGIQIMLRRLYAPFELRELAARKNPLVPKPPPGGFEIVTNRRGNSVKQS